LLNQAAVNRGNSLAGLGQGLANIQLGIGGNMGQSQIAGGQMAMNAGLSKASMPNPMNQLINTGLQLYGMGAFGGAPAAAAPIAAAAPAVSAPVSRGYSYKPSQYGYNGGL
jgi:hypothetical protein